MIVKTLLAAGLAAVLAAPALAATPPVDVYRVAPVIENGKVAALAVTITLPADADGETRLSLPDAWGGGEKLWRFIKDPKVGGGTLSTLDEKTWVIKSKPRAPLTVSYRVVGAYDGTPPFDSVTYAQPIVGPDGFYVVGHTIFARPERRDGDSARFVWAPGGSGLNFASDLERLEKTPGKLNDIGRSVMIASKDLRVLTRDVAGAPVRLAVRDAFGFSDDAFVDMTASVIRAVRGFWGDGGEPFLITLMAYDAPKGWRSRRGSGLGDAFAVISTREPTLDYYPVFLTHEFFHTWNPDQTGGLLDGPQEPLGYWFSEGFTDYYARRLALRSGLISLEAFVADWNQALDAYGVSPVRSAPNAEIAKRFWADKIVHMLPYQRGAQFAVLMEARLKGQGGLDPVMLAMRAAAKTQDPARRGGSAAALFPSVVQARTGVDVTPQIQRYITDGEPVLLPADAFGGCLTVETRTRPSFNAGFDLDQTRKTRIVSGVVPDGPAYAAGLRDGMKYLGREHGADGDGSVEAAYAVQDDGPSRVIRYMPAGKGTVTVQRIVMPKDLTPEARAACVKAVAG
ncbi:M61 family peptidase [uncultured Caulobacter sp.]|uniref:M61 family metallopeptidase n=1 Tax=uncultured Caulobacter sp. TaxID=158749 RepID=UPI0026139C8E|nr:M61 family peptidase [uncultured Caulobacter sp.]